MPGKKLQKIGEDGVWASRKKIKKLPERNDFDLQSYNEKR